MPLPMVHFGVAKELADRLRVRDLPAYYIGVLAPDAYHARPNKSGRDRAVSHLCRADFPPRDVWTADILSYFREPREGPGGGFRLGYQAHLLTDCLWFATVYKTFEERYGRDARPPRDRQRAYYFDTGRLDIELYDALPCRGEIWAHLRAAKGEDFPALITAAEAETERDRTLTWYEPARARYPEPARCLTLAQELSFIRSAADEIDRLLHS